MEDGSAAGRFRQTGQIKTGISFWKKQEDWERGEEIWVEFREIKGKDGVFMIKNKGYGWCNLQIGDFAGETVCPSNAAKALLELFSDYHRKGHGMAWLDGGGVEYSVILTPYSMYVMEEKENTVLHDCSRLPVEKLEKELINDIEAEMDAWAEFPYYMHPDKNKRQNLSKANRHDIACLVHKLKCFVKKESGNQAGAAPDSVHSGITSSGKDCTAAGITVTEPDSIKNTPAGAYAEEKEDGSSAGNSDTADTADESGITDEIHQNRQMLNLEHTDTEPEESWKKDAEMPGEYGCLDGEKRDLLSEKEARISVEKKMKTAESIRDIQSLSEDEQYFLYGGCYSWCISHFHDYEGVQIAAVMDRHHHENGIVHCYLKNPDTGICYDVRGASDNEEYMTAYTGITLYPECMETYLFSSIEDFEMFLKWIDFEIIKNDFLV